jgi:hypothetical protein
MSLKRMVVALVEKGIATTADEMVPHCHGHNREQIINALNNARLARLIHVVGLVRTGKRGHPSGIHAPGPGPKRQPKPPHQLPPNSVFQMADRMAA